MGTRSSQAELVSEFHRLCDVFDCMDECAYLGHDDPERFGGHRFGPIERQAALASVATKASTPAQIVSGVREALNDCSLGLLDVLRQNPRRLRTILDSYRSKTGREYFDDAGHPKKLLKALLRRNKLNDETEYRLLHAFLCESSSSMTEAERHKGDALLATYQPITE